MNNLSNYYNFNTVTPQNVIPSETMNFQYGYSFPPPSDSSDAPFNPFSEQINMTANPEPWINVWLMKIGKTQPILNTLKKQVNPSISSTKESLKKCLDILDQLNTISNDLRTNVDHLSSEEWKKKIVEIGPLKENYSIVINSLKNSDNLKSIKTVLSKRKKKRTAQKKKRLWKQEKRRKEIEEHRKIDQQIDRWLEVKKEEDSRIKRDEIMNKDIDCNLSDVHKKKSDAKKNLGLIRALVKLRQVRETMRAQRGEKTCLEDKQAFSSTTAKLLKIWENALKQYNSEELMLKTMLEESVNDTIRKKEQLKERETVFLWEKAIFGNKVVSTLENVNLWNLTAADRDMETFIAVRRSWDHFLVPPPKGSSLPIGWVFPPNQCAEEWKKYQSH